MPNGGVKVYQLGYERRAVKPRFIFMLHASMPIYILVARSPSFGVFGFWLRS